MLSFVTGFAQAFGGPAYQSLMPTLVPKTAPAERDRAQLDPVQPVAHLRLAARRRGARGVRHGDLLRPQRPLVPRRDRRAAVAVGEAHPAAEHKPMLQEMRGGFSYVKREPALIALTVRRVPDDVSRAAAADVPAGLRAGRVPGGDRPLQPDDGVLGRRLGGRGADRGVAGTLQAHGTHAADRAGRLRAARGGVRAVAHALAERAAAVLRRDRGDDGDRA